MTSRNPGLLHAAGPSFADITRDGDPWVAETPFYFWNGDYLSIGFGRSIPGTPMSEGIGFLVPGFTGEDSYRLVSPTDSTPAGTYGVADNSTDTGYGVFTLDGRPGLLRITGFDPTDSTVAGTFRFMVQTNPSQPSTVTTFEGSFRLRGLVPAAAIGAAPEPAADYSTLIRT